MVAIVDGEHYPPVVRAALEEIDDLVVAAVLVGGTEKLRGDVDGYGVPLAPTVEVAIARAPPGRRPRPVRRAGARPAGAARAREPRARARDAVRGAGFPLRRRPPFEPVDVPTLAVIGTGKRVGKTAVTGHVARRSRATRRSSSSRWGGAGRPSRRSSSCGRRSTRCSSSRAAGRTRRPTTSRRPSSPVSRRSAAGAAAAGSPGAVAVSNVLEGVAVASSARPGARRPRRERRRAAPVAADRRLLVVSAAQPIDVAAGYLNAYRARIADLVVVTMAEDDAPHAELADALRAHVRPGDRRSSAPSCAHGRSSRSPASAWRSSARRRHRRTRHLARICESARRARDVTSPATSPTARACARSSPPSTRTSSSSS